MSNDLIINSSEEEIDIALLEDKQLVELHKESTKGGFHVGDIYLGRVKKLAPGLNAAFVDVGYEKDAFLHYFDLGPQVRSLISLTKKILKGKKFSVSTIDPEPEIEKSGQMTEVLSPEQYVLVQIAKEPISTKGPRLTSEITLAGRYIVLVPFSDRISISSRIKEKEERDRLRRLLMSIKPPNFGVIIRTVAKDIKVAELDADLRALSNKWEEGMKKLRGATPPTKIIGELSKTSVILRDLLNASFNKIHVDNEKVGEQIRNYLRSIAPEKENMVQIHKSVKPIFDKHNIHRQIKALFGRNVTMTSGAYLVIEHTEALHVIDVNSGNTAKDTQNQETTALNVNLEAASEIARQLRLRDMGGIIVVDFIDMKFGENRKKVHQHLIKEMSVDRAKHNVLPISKFGLIEITRQRVRQQMDIKTRESCPSCNGKGEVQSSLLICDEINRFLDKAMGKNGVGKVEVCVHPLVSAYLQRNFYSQQRTWFMKYKKWIPVSTRDNFGLLQYAITDREGNELN